jgi:hypothetical protein
MDDQKDQQTNHAVISIKNEPISDGIEFENNPWNVESLQAFLCLKCPQCVFNTKEKDIFENHAIENHPLSIVLFGRTLKEETHVDKEFNLVGNFLDDKIDSEDPLQSEPDYLDYCESKLDPHIKIEEELKADHQKIGQVFSRKKTCEKMYICKCGKKMASESGLKNHVKNLCGKGKKYKCPVRVCKEVFESFSSRLKHFAVAHPSRTIYECSFCNVKHIEKYKIQQHLKRKHEKEHGSEIYRSLPALKGGNRKCVVCKEIFKSKSEMMKHYTLMHPDASIYNCTMCDEKFVTLNGLTGHNFTAHERKVTDLGCSFCGKEFAEKEELKNHILTAHKDKKYQCSECEASYLSRITLQSHIEQVHERKKHQCSTCGEVFESMIRLETHTALQHDKSKLFKCQTCSATYTRRLTLNHHIASVHDKSLGHLCPECGENFATRQKMKDHVFVVHEGQGYKCQFCSNIYKNKTSRQAHVRKIHEGIKPEPQKCSQCEKIYSTPKSLKLHISAVHEKKRPYACHLCDLSFGQTGNLKTHLKGKHKEFSFSGILKGGKKPKGKIGTEFIYESGQVKNM